MAAFFGFSEVPAKNIVIMENLGKIEKLANDRQPLESLAAFRKSGEDMSIILKLKKSDYERILAYGKQELPNESCGLLAGTVEGEQKNIAKVYFLTNLDASREHFSMDPREQLAAQKDARANGFDVIGNFHSHPESLSRPSREDKRLAYDSSMEYLILSLQDRENPVLKAFGIDQGKNVEVHGIEIVE